MNTLPLAQRWLTVIAALVMALQGCREKYTPKLNDPETGYLVVDGFINGGTGPTTITLTRTTRLSAQPKIAYETGAKVYVLGGATPFTLNETSPGVYVHPQLTLDPAVSYYLQVIANNKTYVSTPSSVRKTPDIDSISWDRESGGVQIHANTHDNNNPVGYYQFRYEDTWEFHSKYTSSLKVYLRNKIEDHVGFRDSIRFADDLSIYKCWKTDTSKRILVTSTAKLTQNVVSKFPLLLIENGSVKLSERYSINVFMYSISQQAFAFQEQLRKNTELLGSIFDGQPSDNYGNMKCITNPAEPVMGFVEISEEKQKRIFINNTQLPNWGYINACAAEVKIANSTLDLVGKSYYIPTKIADSSRGAIDSAWFAPATCVDCTTIGTNKKPAFW